MQKAGSRATVFYRYLYQEDRYERRDRLEAIRLAENALRMKVEQGKRRKLLAGRTIAQCIHESKRKEIADNDCE